MNKKPNYALATAMTLILALGGCGLDQNLTGSTGSEDASVAADSSERLTVSFWSSAPAGKTMGGDKAQKEAEKAAEEAAKEAERAEREAAKEAKKAEREAAREAKKADDEAEDGNGDNVSVTVNADGSQTASAVIGPEGGKIEIRDEGSRNGSHDDQRIRFHVPEGSLTEATLISMTVFGNTLSTLVIAFEPDNTAFDPPAKLQVHLGKDLIDIDVDGLYARHIHGSGESENVKVKTSGKVKKNFMFEIDIFGFSRYSLGK